MDIGGAVNQVHSTSRERTNEESPSDHTPLLPVVPRLSAEAIRIVSPSVRSGSAHGQP